MKVRKLSPVVILGRILYRMDHPDLHGAESSTMDEYTLSAAPDLVRRLRRAGVRLVRARKAKRR
jgi:hypothetical protein